MDSRIDDSQKVSESRRVQRDSALTERDSALQERDDAREERDSARGERDSFKGQTKTMERNRVAQEQFVATLSHDLINPIGAIKMAVEVIRDSPDAETLAEMTDLIGRNADQAEELIRHLLDAHLVKSGASLPIERVECDLLKILQKCQGSLAPKDKERIHLYADDRESVFGFWDPRALERALKNLISNALKFSTPNRSIEIRISQNSALTVIEVQNFGDVISLENQLRIFDSQVRISQADLQRKQGWGLGLTLVRGIAEAHRGKIEVSSSVAEGTVFTLKIPTDTRKPL